MKNVQNAKQAFFDVFEATPDQRKVVNIFIIDSSSFLLSGKCNTPNGVWINWNLNDQNNSFVESLAFFIFEEMLKIFIQNPCFKGKLVVVAITETVEKLYTYFHCCSF